MFGIELLASRHPWAVSRRLAALVILWFAIGVVPRSAAAQSEADRATARNLAAEGYTALKTQDFLTAEDRFRRADALVHAPTLVVDHARALIGLGRYVEAQERLELVIREGVADNAPWVWKKALQDAEQLVSAAKPKVAWLTINVTGPSDSVVQVDGTQVPGAAMGVRRAVDPGPRRIRAVANGYLPKEISVAMPEGGERAVTLELTPDPGNGTQTAPKAEVPKANQPTPAKPPKERNNAVAFAALGLGGAGLVVGTVTGLLALTKRSDLLDICQSNHRCPPEEQSKIDEYKRYGIISGVGFGVGIVSSAVGIWLLLSNSSSEAPKRPKAASVVPYVAMGDLGLTGVF